MVLALWDVKGGRQFDNMAIVCDSVPFDVLCLQINGEYCMNLYVYPSCLCRTLQA